jgi:hypothetical protein
MDGLNNPECIPFTVLTTQESQLGEKRGSGSRAEKHLQLQDQQLDLTQN